MRLITDSSSDISRRSLRAAADSRTAPFSVLMTTYAGERAEFLEAALLSIIDQTLAAAQIVLVVDGPIDAAQHAVLDRGAEQATAAGSQFIQVDRAQCGGLAIALNHGLRHCSEPWIARMDSDDHAPPHRLAMQWEFLAAHPDIDVLAGYQMEFSAHPAQVDRVKTIPERHDDIARVLRWRNTISHPSVVMRSDAVRRVGGYHEIGLLEDYDLMLRMLAAGARFHGLQRPRFMCGSTTPSERGVAAPGTPSRSCGSGCRSSVGPHLARQPGRVGAVLRGVPDRPPSVKRAAYRLVRRWYAGDRRAARPGAGTMTGSVAPDDAFAIVTPARNEAKYLQQTIDSMVAQSLRPREWIIVDDGSTDATAAIAERAAAVHPWIRLLKAPDRGERVVGAGVIEAFNLGLRALQCGPTAFLCKLDADLVLPPDYFTHLVAHFHADPALGIASGRIVERVGGQLELLRYEPEMVFGACKFYRRECSTPSAIEVAMAATGSTSIRPCAGAGARPRSTTRRSTFCTCAAWGHRTRRSCTARAAAATACIQSVPPVWVLASAAYRMADRPYILAGVAVLVGYCAARLRDAPRIGDPEFAPFLRRWQMRKLRHKLGRLLPWRAARWTGSSRSAQA